MDNAWVMVVAAPLNLPPVTGTLLPLTSLASAMKPAPAAAANAALPLLNSWMAACSQPSPHFATSGQPKVAWPHQRPSLLAPRSSTDLEPSFVRWSPPYQALPG